MQRVTKRVKGGFIYPTRKTKSYSYRKPKSGKSNLKSRKSRKNKQTNSKINKSKLRVFSETSGLL